MPAPKNGLVEVKTYVPGGDQINKMGWRGQKSIPDSLENP